MIDMEDKNIINIKKVETMIEDDFIPTIHLEKDETLQDLFDRLPTTVYKRAVKCIAKALSSYEDYRKGKVTLFYLGEVDLVEIPFSGWELALKNAEEHFASIEEYEACTQIVKLLKKLEDVSNI